MDDRRRNAKRTKAFLVDRVHRRHGALTKQEASEIVDTIFGAVKETLVSGTPVRIKNFGVFEIVSRVGRAGVNPASGEPLYIPPHNGLQFRPAKLLREQVDHGRDEPDDG